MPRDVFRVAQANQLVTLITANSTEIFFEGMRQQLPMSKIVSGMQEYVNEALEEADALGLPKPTMEVYFEDQTEGVYKGDVIGVAEFSFRVQADPNHWSFAALGGEAFRVGE